MQRSLQEKILLYRISGKRDAEAFAELYDAYVAPVYRFVYLKLSNKEEAEDVTSEVFMRTWDYLIQDETKPVDSFRALIYRIARNKVIDVYRERAKRKECSIDDVAEIHVEANMHVMVDVGIESERVFRFMKQLKQEYQEIIHLKHIEGLSVREIAKILGKSSGNIRVILHRAVKKLQELSGAAQ